MTRMKINTKLVAFMGEAKKITPFSEVFNDT
jgi:hypothetical protein